MREWDNTNGDALAHAVVSVPVVLKTDLEEKSEEKSLVVLAYLVLLVVSEVVSIVDVDLVPGDVAPDVIAVRLASLGAEGDQSIPARAVIVVNSLHELVREKALSVYSQ